MNVVKCTNGHFFDGDSYPNCPHCGAAADSGEQAAFAEKNKSSKGGLFGKLLEKSKATHHTEQQPNHIFEVPEAKASDDGTSITGVMEEKKRSQDSLPDKSDKNHTLDFWQASAKDEIKMNDDSLQHELSTEDDLYQQDDFDGEENGLHSDTESAESVTEKVDLLQASLTDTVKKASANSEGKTMSYFSSMTDNTDNSSEKSVINEPVVGWLVSVSGKHFGESFKIGAGKNSIGRNDDNRIVLSLDNAVSRSKHAIITYEPKKRNFYIQPGDSSGLTYLNDEYITETKQIRRRDIIEIGDSRLIFIPLCGDEFTWEDYIEKE